MLHFLVLFLAINSLSAFSVGRDGDPYFEEAVSWQPVKYVNHDCGYKAALPGDSRSCLANDLVYNYSEFEGTVYEIHTNLNGRYQPPKTEHEFLTQIEVAFGDIVEIQPILSNQRKVKYVVDLVWKEKNKMARLFCSSNQLYWALIEGNDLSLAPFFFETVQITK